MREIIEKEYTTSELSFFDKMVNQTLSGNMDYLMNDIGTDLMSKFGDWLSKYDNIKLNDKKNLYNYKESIEKRLERLYKEMKRLYE